MAQKSNSAVLPDANASSSSTKKQVVLTSTVKGFNLTKAHVRLYFVSKDSAILGDKTTENMRFAMELIGHSVDYSIVGTVQVSRDNGTVDTFNKISIVCIS